MRRMRKTRRNFDENVEFLQGDEEEASEPEEEEEDEEESEG